MLIPYKLSGFCLCGNEGGLNHLDAPAPLSLLNYLQHIEATCTTAAKSLRKGITRINTKNDDKRIYIKGNFLSCSFNERISRLVVAFTEFDKSSMVFFCIWYVVLTVFLFLFVFSETKRFHFDLYKVNCFETYNSNLN